MPASYTKGAQDLYHPPGHRGALGYIIQLPTEDRFLLTEEELMGKIDVEKGDALNPV